MQEIKTIDEAKALAIAKADELSKQLSVKVHPIVFKENEGKGFVIGYLKQASRLQKLAVTDKAALGAISAAGELVDVLLLKEHSDPRILSENEDCDAYFMGAASAVYEQIKFAANLLKKK